MAVMVIFLADACSLLRGYRRFGGTQNILFSILWEKNRGPTNGPCSCLSFPMPRFFCSSRRWLPSLQPNLTHFNSEEGSSIFLRNIDIHKTTRRQKLENHRMVKDSDAIFGSLYTGCPLHVARVFVFVKRVNLQLKTIYSCSLSFISFQLILSPSHVELYV